MYLVRYKHSICMQQENTSEVESLYDVFFYVLAIHGMKRDSGI